MRDMTSLNRLALLWLNKVKNQWHFEKELWSSNLLWALRGTYLPCSPFSTLRWFRDAHIHISANNLHRGDAFKSRDKCVLLRNPFHVIYSSTALQIASKNLGKIWIGASPNHRRVMKAVQGKQILRKFSSKPRIFYSRRNEKEIPA